MSERNCSRRVWLWNVPNNRSGKKNQTRTRRLRAGIGHLCLTPKIMDAIDFPLWIYSPSYKDIRLSFSFSQFPNFH